MKVSWMKTAPRTYMTHLEDGKGSLSIVIKGVDDLFFVYTKRVGSGDPYKQQGFFNRLGAAKEAVQRTADRVMEVSK